MTTATENFSSISVKDLAQKCENEQVDFIDVRTPAEFREVHSVYARNVPLDSLDPKKVQANRDGDKPLYVICKSGNRSSKACEALIKGGLSNIVNVEGGTSAWDAAGLPVKRGKKTISLERQVRIAAGFLAFLGAALAIATNNVYWSGLSGFIGAGLMFAGITDTCGMAMVLAKMPWNQVKCDDGSSCSA